MRNCALCLQVSWRILGPNNPGQVLSDTSDIAYRVNNVDVTQGTLVWGDGEAGEKRLMMYIKPHNGWEIQKQFVVEIYSVTGAPSGVGDGEADPDRSRLTLTVRAGWIVVVLTDSLASSN